MLIKLTCDQFLKRWAVYSVITETNQPIFVGCIKLTNLYTLSDFRMTIDFRCDEKITVMLIGTYDKKSGAIVEQSRKIREMGLTVEIKTRASAVLCVTTGETFASAQEAVDVHNLTYSALSNHLNRRPGYLSVKSKVYERIQQIEYLKSKNLISQMPPPPKPVITV